MKNRLEVSILEEKLKLFLCDLASQREYFGLRYPLTDDRPTWGSFRVALKHRNLKKLKTDKLFMLQCPPLQFTSLETDLPVVLSIRYYISTTHKSSSFIIYLQEGDYQPVYPHKFAFKVNHDTLETLYSQFIEEFMDIPFESSILPVHSSPLEIQEIMLRLLDFRRLKNAYSKFVVTSRIDSVCGLPRVHKLSLCRLAVKQVFGDLHEVDPRGWDESDCRRRWTWWSEDDGHTYAARAPVGAVKCPAVRQGVDGRHRLLRTSLFLSRGRWPSSFLLSYRENSKGEPIHAFSCYKYYQLETWLKDRRRTRELMRPRYLPEDELEVHERKMRELHLKLPRITFDRGLTEDNVIALSMLVTLKRPYYRFQHIFDRLIVSGLLNDEIGYLCYQILNHRYYDLDDVRLGERTDPPKEVTYNMDIRLVMRDAENLLAEKLRAKQCGTASNDSFVYFIGGSARRNSVIVYVWYRGTSEQYADALVDEVDLEDVRVSRKLTNVMMRMFDRPDRTTSTPAETSSVRSQIKSPRDEKSPVLDRTTSAVDEIKLA